MIEVIKYVGRDKDTEEYSEAPIDTVAEANRIAYLESKKFPRTLFAIAIDDKILTYWWQGAQRTEREIEIRRRNHQWSY